MTTEKPSRAADGFIAKPQDFHKPSDLLERLVQRGLLESRDAEFARYYQERLASKGYPSSLAKVLVELSLIDPLILSQILLEEKESKAALLQSPPSNTAQPAPVADQKETSPQRWRDATAQTLQQCVTAPNQYELLHSFSNSLLQQFSCNSIAVYLNESDRTLVLQHQATAQGTDAPRRETSILHSAPSPQAWTARTRQVYLSSTGDTLSPQPPAAGESKAGLRACLPMLYDGSLVGVIDIETETVALSTPAAIEALKTTATSLAALIRHHQMLDTTRAILGELSVHHQISQGYALAKTTEEVHRHTIKTLKQLPCQGWLLRRRTNQWLAVKESETETTTERVEQALNRRQLAPAQLEDLLAFQDHLLIKAEAVATELAEDLRLAIVDMGFQEAAIIPVRDEQHLIGLILVGSERAGCLDQKLVQFCIGVAELVSSALNRVQTLENIQRRLERIQVMDSVSQSIAVELDLEKLYAVLHQQILRVLGEVDFIIATYDANTNLIQIPYAYENQQVISIPPFPLGEGLTSILIKTGKPLMLVEDTEDKARELGAKIIGAPAKSWLGVPLMVGGETLGAMIVQDLEVEHRFDDEDLKMLSTLSTQVATALRNARLIYEAREKARREKQAVEISQKIWSAVNVDTILKTALDELGKALHASKGYVKLEMADEELAARTGGKG